MSDYRAGVMSEGPGYFFVIGPCFLCRELFMFNPELIICPVVNIGYGEEAVTCCESCMKIVNVARKAGGLEPIPILPAAYQPAPLP